MISVDDIYSNVVLVTFITLSIYIVFAIQHKSNTLTDDDVTHTCDCIIAKISRLSSKNKYTKYVQKKSNKDMRRIESANLKYKIC
jgi:hypothetical protein